MTVAMTLEDTLYFMRQHGAAEQPYFDLLRTRSRIPAGSAVLGYEVVGAEWTLDFHSWHCHGYAAEVFDELRVQLNEFGLIDTYEQASRLLTWMLRQAPENQPEPVEWTVVAIVRP